jgi:cleavage and polyadenylation specificity factor subunit 2
LLSFFKGTSVTKDVYAPKNGEEIRIGEHVASYSIMLGDSISNHLSAKWSKVSFLQLQFGPKLITFQFEGYEVAMLDGIVALSAGSTVPTLEAAGQAIATITELKQETAGDIEDTKPTTGEGVDSSEIDVKMEPDLEPIAMPEKPAAKPMTPGALPGSLFVGDLRLANLKQRLSTLSPPIPAEFAGEGILICGEGISQGENAKGGSIVAVRKLAEGQIVLEGGIGKTYTAVRTELYKGFARVTAA